MANMLRQLALALSLLMLCSCATIFAKDTRSIMVTSSPPGADIVVNGAPAGVTPIRVDVDDHEILKISIRKEGFHGGGCIVNTRIRAIWVIVDVVLFVTVLPLVVDLLTGQWATLKSEYCTVNLSPLGGA